MTDLPFGFSPAGGPDDLAGKIPFFAELQKLMSWSGGPVNWDLARQVATAAAGPADRPVPDEVPYDAMRLADHWLDGVTTLPSGVRGVVVWNRVAWVERTLKGWAALVDPVAAKVVAAMADALPEEVRAQAGPLAGMMGQFGGLMFGAQVGQALGALSGEVLSASDVGVPLGEPGVAALLPHNVAAFGTDLEVPASDVTVYVALREAAHQRLFGQVPWLRGHVLAAVEAYAAGISIDTSALDRAMLSVDPSNPESVQDALGGGLFSVERTPEQQAALLRLETALALVEGWVDDVVGAAAAPYLPTAAALAETMRRRRATGGPAEQTFATLVGLELRPRRLREAATVFRWLREQRGPEGRDAVWAHPDLLPTSEDLTDPVDYLRAEPSDGPPVE
ncbi:MAG TPA: zinc-dependent metalloprotease [Mycobacteriales bacterium]|jgi:putative hydrolase|nr:zinc-dependent metalloprotease [Mycobacteriales bacterium]